ncbi:beta-ketoacyl-ACP synthase 3 [Streptomyces sp. NPDC047097]|uniref:3-oxoacyl-ACP synthase III family protein n=1 Tax=Streptomyces sp. NPDC047097 TaxID=3155260 RepID=UPI0033E0839C
MLTRPSGTEPAQPASSGSTDLRLPVGVLGTGTYVPTDVVTNEMLTQHLDTTDSWIRTRTGIEERRVLPDGLATSDMAIAAARKALAAARTSPADLDAVIVATYTPDQPLPSTALMVIDALGASRAVPFDLAQGACAGGVYAMVLAAHLLQNEALGRVLVIGADCAWRVTDPLDRTARVFFGDAAGAAVLGRTPPGYGLLSWDLGSALSYKVAIPAGGSRNPTTANTLADRGHYLKMDGKAVWDTATRCLPQSIRETVRRAGLSLQDVRFFLFHQANANIIAKAMQELGVEEDRAPLTLRRLGNTGAASVFTALHKALSEEAEHDDVMVMAAIGAGFLWGSLSLRHYAKDDACSR